jgi:hypothetical protein
MSRLVESGSIKSEYIPDILNAVSNCIAYPKGTCFRPRLEIVSLEEFEFSLSV